MNDISRKTLISVLAAAVWLFTVPGARADFVPQVAGTWQITGTPAPNPCGVDAPFTNVAVISIDGTLVNSDPQVGTAVGEVFRIKPRRYGGGFFGLFSPAPGLLFQYEVQGTLKVNWDGTAAGKFRTILTETNGLVPQCIYEGTIDGHKLSPMPY